MPLNSEPPVVRLEAFAEKRRLAEAKSRTDFALWGGLVPGSIEHLSTLADAGAVGFKAFLCDSGMASFPAADPGTLRAGMKAAAALGVPVGVHAEDDGIVRRLGAAALAQGRRSVRAYLDSRPVDAEVAAIRLAVDLAGETGCRLHVVHVSSPEGLDVIREGRNRKVDVTAETCPHYLLLNENDVERLGAPAKCSPPIRGEGRRRELWRRLLQGGFDSVGSDHSPAPPALKANADFFLVWGGIAGIQHGPELLLSEAEAEVDWPVLSAVLAENPARRFGLGRAKGRIAVGADADFCLVQSGAARLIEPSELVTRHRISPYLGRASRIRVTRTFLRGRQIWPDSPEGGVPPPGRFLRPER